MTVEVHQFPCLSDNYGFLVHDPVSGETAAIEIWNTHWHPDNAGGNAAIKAATGCTITAPAADAAKIEGTDRTVEQGDSVALGAFTAQVIDVGGHTLGHCAYHLPQAAVGAHEYTASNARFALAVDPDPAVKARAEAVFAARERGEPTVPSTLAEEKATNPFLRAPRLRPGLPPHEAFAALRGEKDVFRG